MGRSDVVAALHHLLRTLWFVTEIERELRATLEADQAGSVCPLLTDVAYGVAVLLNEDDDAH